MMCQTELSDNEWESPSEKARKQLQKRISDQKVRRFYRTAQSRNFGESRNLGVQLKTLSNAEHEYQREFTANQKLFKINRRRQIESLVHVKVKNEIQSLQRKRRESAMISELTIAKNIENASKLLPHSSETVFTKAIEDTPLPQTVTAALHEGVPTMLSRPKIIKRIKTAPVYGRRQSVLPFSPATVTISDPLRLLERVETSEGFTGMRKRLVRKAASAVPGGNISLQKTERPMPDYLALDTLEADHIRANMKQQEVNRCKILHAGSDERCADMVQKWINKRSRLPTVDDDQSISKDV